MSRGQNASGLQGVAEPVIALVHAQRQGELRAENGLCSPGATYVKSGWDQGAGGGQGSRRDQESAAT